MFKKTVRALVNCVWTNRGMCEYVCATCLLACGCAGVERVMAADGNEEVQERNLCTMDREW